MQRRSRNSLRRLAGDRRGVTALEFALVAPLLFGVLFVVVEISVIMLADAHLDVAANQVARLGRLRLDGDCGPQVRKVMSDTLAHWVDAASMRIDAKVYTPGANNAFDEVGEDYQPVCDTGERGDMVIYRLGFDRTGLTGFIGWLGGDRLRFERVVLIQNEP